MDYRAKQLQACFRAGLRRIPDKLISAVAAVAAVAVAVSLTVTLSKTAAADRTASSAASMAAAVTYVRTHDDALAHASSQTIEAQITAMAENVTETDSATGNVADFLGVSKSGSTLWFNKADVVAWAVAGSALIIATLQFMGVSIEIAYEYLHLLIDTMAGAAFGHRCAWFTYKSPRSLGTYSC